MVKAAKAPERQGQEGLCTPPGGVGASLQGQVECAYEFEGQDGDLAPPRESDPALGILSMDAPETAATDNDVPKSASVVLC